MVKVTSLSKEPVKTGAHDALVSRKQPHIYDPIATPNVLKTVTSEDIYLLGGQYAILCQFAHPGLAKGSYLHSNFASRIAQRLQNTARFLNAAVFGNRREQEAIFSVIHKYHALVKGDGYDANDPELHKWTAATLFVSIVIVHEVFFGKLSQSKMEALFRESAIFGTSLRMSPDMWPETLDEFWAYWNRNIATLEVTPEAKSLAQDLLYPKNLPMWLQIQTPVARLVTTHWLPERLAREYGLQATPANRALYYTVVGWISVLYPYLPEGVRSNRHRQYMEDLERAVVRVENTGHWAGV